MLVVAAIHAAPTPSSAPSHISADSPAQLKPPAGWTPEKIPHSNYPGRKAIYQWLYYGRGDEEYVQLSQRYFPNMSTADFARFYRGYLQATQNVIYADRPVTLCNGEQAWYMRHSMGPYSSLAAEDVFTAADGYAYVAQYFYPAKWKPLDAGEQSVRSLCLKTPPRPVVVHLPVRFSPPAGWVSIPYTKSTAPYPGTLAEFSDVHSYPAKHRILIAAEDATTDSDAGSDKGATSEDNRRAEKADTKMHQSFKDVATFEVNACGTRAWYTTFTETFEGVTVKGEQVMLDGSTLYTAVYLRSATAPESPQARAALKTFCPLQTPEPEPTDTPTPSVAAPQSTQTQTPAPAASPSR